MTVEAKNDQPSSAEVIDLATVFGIALALCIPAISVGLIGSETASDVRTLTANGASSRTRRNIRTTTAGGPGLIGAVLGTVVGYARVIGWMIDRSVDRGLSSLGKVPVANLLVILLGMPLVATATSWLLAGREPLAVAHQPAE